jgi:hypothetical protein
MFVVGQKRPKLSWLPAAKSTTEQGVKFVPQEDLPVLPQKSVPEPLWSRLTSRDDWAAKRGRCLSGFLGPLDGFSVSLKLQSLLVFTVFIVIF